MSIPLSRVRFLSLCECLSKLKRKGLKLSWEEKGKEAKTLESGDRGREHMRLPGIDRAIVQFRCPASKESERRGTRWSKLHTRDHFPFALLCNSSLVGHFHPLFSSPFFSRHCSRDKWKTKKKIGGVEEELPYERETMEQARARAFSAGMSFCHPILSSHPSFLIRIPIQVTLSSSFAE